MSTTSTQLSDIIPSESIDNVLRQPHFSALTALTIADADTVGKGRGPTVRLARVDRVAAPQAGTKAENDEFNIIAHTTDSEDLSAGTVGYSARLSYEADYDTVFDAFVAIVQAAGKHMSNRVDADGLGVAATAANTESFSGDPLTDDRVLIALATYQAQEPNLTAAGTALVLPPTPLSYWTRDLAANNAGYLGGDAESARVSAMMSPQAGYKGTRHGLHVFLSTNVPTALGDALCPIVPMGRGGPLAYRNWKVITLEDEKEPRRQAFLLTFSARYGWQIADDDDCLVVETVNS